MIDSVERENAIQTVTEIRDNLKEAKLTKIGIYDYELEVAHLTYYLVYKDEKWKVNPYTYKIFK